MRFAPVGSSSRGQLPGDPQVSAIANDVVDMGKPDRMRRPGAHARRGRHRADSLANRLATGLREGRAVERATQQQAADRCGISQARWSDLERGHGERASLETWALAASAVGLQLAAFMEGAPGADRPRDMEHAIRQSGLIEFAAPGGWRALPELTLEPAIRSRSIDVALVRDARREAVAVEIWDWFDDVGGAFRGLDAKKLLLRERLDREHGSDRESGWERELESDA